MDQNGLIRLIQLSDLPALEWDGQYVHFRRVYREVYEQYRMGRALPWIVETYFDGIIGQLFVQLDSQNKNLADGLRRAYLFSFRVKPQFQRRGWGTKLLSFVETYLLEQGFHWTTLKVSKLNEPARQFYEHRGYSIIAEEHSEWKYIDHQGSQRVIVEPSYLMEKCLVKENSPC